MVLAGQLARDGFTHGLYTDPPYRGRPLVCPLGPLNPWFQRNICAAFPGKVVLATGKGPRGAVGGARSYSTRAKRQEPV